MLLLQANTKLKYERVCGTLAQTNAYHPSANRFVAVKVKGHACEIWTGGSGAEIGRMDITTPAVTILVTITSETRHKKSGVKRSITD